jgi:hypothetical protein
MKSIILVLLFSLLVIPVSTQKKSRSNRKKVLTSTEVRLKKDKPHVFISYEKQGEIAPLSQSQSNRRYWLRFHNNSIFTVMICISVVPKDYGDYGVRYEVERYQGFGPVPGVGSSDNCQNQQIESGDVLNFSVPQEHLAEGLAIKIRFKYYWELDPNGSFNPREAYHYVYFYPDDIEQK